MVEQPPNVRLDLANTPENVVLVREMLSGVAEAIDLHGSDLNDIRTAVTEACNNVVLHAYRGEQGPLEVEARLAQNALSVVVRDRGYGIQTPSDRLETTTLGIGLHVIRTLTRHVEFRGVSGGGTEVRMEFAALSIGVPAPHLKESLGLPAFASADSTATATVSITPISLARTVLPRLMSVLAARAHFSTDRISDAQLLADALAAHAHGAMEEDHLSVGMNVEPRELELHIAPLGDEYAQRLIGDSTLDGLGSVIERLTDRHGVKSAGPYEMLTLGLVDRK
jgi:serine/threonine-protein kinase RsbW